MAVSSLSITYVQKDWFVKIVFILRKTPSPNTNGKILALSAILFGMQVEELFYFSGCVSLLLSNLLAPSEMICKAPSVAALGWFGNVCSPLVSHPAVSLIIKLFKDAFAAAKPILQHQNWVRGAWPPTHIRTEL